MMQWKVNILWHRPQTQAYRSDRVLGTFGSVETEKMTDEQDRKKEEMLCTASNKAFLCRSSRIITFSWFNSHMWQKTSCKMSAKHLRLSWWPINLPPWTKQPNILLSSWRSEYIFSIGVMKDGPSLRRRRRKQIRGVHLPLVPLLPPPTPHSFLGLLGDHVARGGHGTAAVRLLFLSWFQNLK